MVVKKPWGYEYIVYDDKDKIGITFLNIKYKHKTSLHCHPKKKTGFILLDGVVDIDLGFYDRKRIKSLEKIMIRPGLFHQTKAISNIGAKVIEIESPKNKQDLIRFKDSYGRQNKPYEGQKYMSTLNKNAFLIKENNKIQKNEGYSFKISNFNKKNKISLKNKKSIYAIIGGGLGPNKNSLVLSPGDIVRHNTINKLSKVFKPVPTIKILSITKC